MISWLKRSPSGAKAVHAGFPGSHEVGPFKQFGQFGPGQMDIRVFDQDTFWVDKNGVAHAVGEMSHEYLCNVVRFLEDGCSYFHLCSSAREVGESLVSALSDETPWLVLARELGVPSVVETDARAWLESTPLMRKLRQSVSANGRNA